MKIARRLCAVLVLLLLLALCTFSAFAADSTVPELEFSGTVEKSGQCKVTLVVSFSFPEPSGEIRIPLGENVRSVSVSGGGAYQKTIDDSVWVILRGSKGTVGNRTCIVTYTKTSCVTVKDSGQQLDIQLVSPLWETSIDHVTYSLTLPAEFSAKPGYQSGYYGETVMAKDSVEAQAIRGEIVGGLLDRESVDLLLQLPPRYFRLWHQVGETATLDLVLFLLCAAAGAAYWYLKLRNPIVRAQPRRRPPEGLSAWEFPHIAEGGAFDPTLLYSEWAVLGYLTIRVAKTGRILLSPRIPMGSERRPLELTIFRTIFRDGTPVTADTAELRRLGKQAAQNARDYWVSRLYAPDSGNPLFTDLFAALAMGFAWMRGVDYLLPDWTLRILLLLPSLALGAAGGVLLQQSFRALFRRRTDGLLTGGAALLITLLLALGNGGALLPLGGILLQLLDARLTLHGGRCIPSALEFSAQIHAFRRFLRRADPHHLQLVLAQDGQYFYRLLPYAEAMGVGRQFARCFANLPLEPCAWLQGERLHYQTAQEFYRCYRAVLGKMRGTPGARLPKDTESRKV